MSEETALVLLDMEDSAITETVNQLLGESVAVAELMSVLRVFTRASDAARLEDLPAQSLEIRRSHLTLLVALIDDARARLVDIFAAIDLEGRIPDADLIDPVHDGLTTAGQALAEIVSALHNPRQ